MYQSNLIDEHKIIKILSLLMIVLLICLLLLIHMGKLLKFNVTDVHGFL